QADQEDDLGLLDPDELVEPGAAEFLLGRRGDAIAPGAGEPAGGAAGDGAEVDLGPEPVAREASALEPGAELLARRAGERAVLVLGAEAGGLADQEDPGTGGVGLGVARDRDRLGLVEVARLVAAAAGADPGVEGRERRALPGRGRGRGSGRGHACSGSGASSTSTQRSATVVARPGRARLGMTSRSRTTLSAQASP